MEHRDTYTCVQKSLDHGSTFFSLSLFSLLRFYIMLPLRTRLCGSFVCQYFPLRQSRNAFFSCMLLRKKRQRKKKEWNSCVCYCSMVSRHISWAAWNFLRACAVGLMVFSSERVWGHRVYGRNRFLYVYGLFTSWEIERLIFSKELFSQKVKVFCCVGYTASLIESFC